MDHRPFLVALALGAALRVVVMLAFTPSLMMSDGPTYLGILDRLAPDQDRPIGYTLLLLLPVTSVSDTLVAVTVAQHLLGLSTAVLLYVLMRRWGVGPRLATVATLPVLLDAMLVLLEHAPLSDTFFMLLVTAGVVVLGWRRRPTPALALAAGLLLGTSVTVRQVGVPLVLAAVVFCLVAGRGWRDPLTTSAVVALAFAVPVGGYAAWYHSEHGVYALSEIGGKSTYMRSTSFVDCAQLSVPDYQRVLCPPEPRGERRDPTDYGWRDARTIPRLEPPSGTTPNEAMRQFGREAIRTQPVDYAMIVLRDVALNFDLWRGDRFELHTAFKWQFSAYVDDEPTAFEAAAFDAHGGQRPTARQPWAGAMVVYQWFGYVPGPLLLGCLAMGLRGAAGVGRARLREVQPMCLLLTTTGAGLMLVPAVTTQFVWRYQLPALVLLPAAAALTWSALRAGRAPVAPPGQAAGGTVATPRTD